MRPKWAKFCSGLRLTCIEAKWMSRQARWIGWVAAKAAVPLMVIRASMALTQSSAERAQSRIVRARKANEGGDGVCAVSTARRNSNSATSRSAAARASRT